MNVMNGRWTIRKWNGGSEVLGPLTVGEGYQGNGDVPVVPCDDAAVERARQAIIDSHDVIPVGEEPFPGWSLVLAERALRAAGEVS